MIERWKYLHEWWIEDITFEIKQQEEIKVMLLKHPDDDLGNIFRDMLKSLEKRMNKMLTEYKKIYGNRPNIRHIRSSIQGAMCEQT